MRRKTKILALTAAMVLATGLSLLAQSGKDKKTDPAVKDGGGAKAKDSRQQKGQDKQDKANRRARSLRKRVSDEMEKQVLALLKKKKPGLHAQLMRIKEESPRRYYWIILEQSRWQKRYENMPARVQQAMLTQYDQRLRILRLRRLVAQVRRSKDQEQLEELEARLRESVTEHFDASQIIRKHTLAVLRKRIESIEEEIRSRDAQREKLIQKEVESIVRPRARRQRSAQQDADKPKEKG
jgi:hypothetical protein